LGHLRRVGDGGRGVKDNIAGAHHVGDKPVNVVGEAWPRRLRGVRFRWNARKRRGGLAPIRFIADTLVT
jgi:hypothetical protein